MKGLIEERFGALAFMEKLQRQPGAGAPDAEAARLRLLAGADPQAADGLAADVGDETAWAAQRARAQPARPTRPSRARRPGRRVRADRRRPASARRRRTAKIAAAFAARHGAANLGLITLDAYRVGAHEQLRAYGRILGVPVHTAHDRASLEDLLDLLAAKKMVLIDTAGMAQRDARTARAARHARRTAAIQKLLVVNAASQGETIEDVLVAYRAASCAGVVLSQARRGGQARPGARRADPPQAQGRRRRQRPARARGLAPPVGAGAGAARAARRRQRRLAHRRRPT